MPGVLELAQLVETHGVPEMDVGRGGVDAELDPQRASLTIGARELGFERAFGKHLDGADALAIITDWNEYRNPDFDRIKSALKSPTVVDGRNLYKPDRMATAGFNYVPLGRCGGGISGGVK